MLKRFYLVFQCVKMYFSTIKQLAIRWAYDEYTPWFSVWFANKYRTHPLLRHSGNRVFTKHIYFQCRRLLRLQLCLLSFCILLGLTSLWVCFCSWVHSSCSSFTSVVSSVCLLRSTLINFAFYRPWRQFQRNLASSIWIPWWMDRRRRQHLALRACWVAGDGQWGWWLSRRYGKLCLWLDLQNWRGGRHPSVLCRGCSGHWPRWECGGGGGGGGGTWLGTRVPCLRRGSGWSDQKGERSQELKSLMLWL